MVNLPGGSSFPTFRGKLFMIVPWRHAPNGRIGQAGSENRIDRFCQGGSAAARGGQENQNSSRWGLKNRLPAPWHYPGSDSTLFLNLVLIVIKIIKYPAFRKVQLKTFSNDFLGSGASEKPFTQIKDSSSHVPKSEAAEKVE